MTGSDRAPSRVATGAALVALLTLALAAAGGLGLLFGSVSPLLAQGALVVAVGGSILGVTISAIGLMTTRPGSDPDHLRRRRGRQRAWLGAGLSLALLLALLVGFQLELGGAVVVPDDAAEATEAS